MDIKTFGIIIINKMMSESSSFNEEVTPYNSKNVLLSLNDLTFLLKTHGVRKPIHDLNIYRMAFVHKSYCTRKNENFVTGNTNCPEDCLALQECSNERLEFLGDSVLGLIVANYLYERYPDNEEGFLTKIRTRIVNGQMLAQLSAKIGLNKFVLISKQIEDNDGRNNHRILEDIFEAFLGAIFLDFGHIGFQVANDFIVNVIETHIDFSELILANNNYKDMLLKYYQHNSSSPPRFVELSVENRAQGKSYTIGVRNKDGMIIGTGKGNTKKQGENEAAKSALKYLGQFT